MVTCKRQHSLKLWNACPTKWAKEGRRAERNCLSLLRKITVTSKPWREEKRERQSDSFLSFAPSHLALLTTFLSALSLLHVLYACQRDFSQHSLKNYVFSFCWTKEMRIMMDWFRPSLLLFRFLAGWWLPSQWAVLWSVNETGCIQYWETHLYGCNTSRVIVIFVLSLRFCRHVYLPCQQSKVKKLYAEFLALGMWLKMFFFIDRAVDDQ